MARRAQTKAVTAQMYRHFAVLTVGVTLAVGVFADGESRKAIASEARAAAPAPKAGPTELVRKDARGRGSFTTDDGFDQNFGAPMDTTGAAAQDGVLPDNLTQSSDPGVPVGFTEYGVSSTVWASLSEEQRKALMARQKAERAAAQAPERTKQIESLLAASRARSGNVTVID